jgi:EpsI family protein
VIFKPLALKPAVLLLSFAIMLSCVGVAQYLKPHKYWADHTGEPNYEKLIPHSFGDWEEVPYANRGVVNPVQEENLKRIYSQTFARTFVNKRNGRGIMLSIAYGRDQTNDTQLHTPDMCYPSQGFRVDKREDADVASPAGPIKAVRLVTMLGTERKEPLTYFIRVGDAVTRGSKERNIERLKLALRGYLVDGTLFRVSEVTRDGNPFPLQDQFIADLLNALPEHDRGYIVGKRES